MMEAAGRRSGPTAVPSAPVSVRLARSERRQKLRNLALILPLFAFISVTFVVPILSMLYRSVDNPVIATALPRTLVRLESWRPSELPDEETYRILAEELAAAREAKLIGKVGSRLNYELSGIRSVVTRTAARFQEDVTGPYKDAFIQVNKRWGEPEIWAKIKQLGGPISGAYYLNALDRTRDNAGEIVPRPEYQQIYVTLFARTLWISLSITAICVLLAYPIA